LLERARKGLTYANVTATLALFLALTGGIAWALEANSVRSRHIVNGQVKGADLSPTNVRLVDAAGEPPFHDGGSGDCDWESTQSSTFPRVPVGFFREPTGVVHLQGMAKAVHGTGGDAQCDSDGTAAENDGFIFQLPAGYRPPATVTIPFVNNSDSNEENGLLITGTEETGPGGGFGTFPPGSVLYAGSEKPMTVLLDGISFRCGPSGQDGCP
jgi:hypothetical protein